MHDNDPAAKKFIRENVYCFEMYGSPDLNSMENLCGYVKEAVAASCPSSTNELWKVVQVHFQ